MTVMTLMIPSALLLSVWTSASLRWAAGDEVAISRTGTAVAALIGYLGVLIALSFGPGYAPWEVETALCVFGALLLVAGWVDHRTAWAPDGVILPLMVCGSVSAALIGSLSAGPVWAIGVAVLIFGLAQAAWAVQAVLGHRVLPPPDLISLSLPVLLFGLTHYTFLAYLTLSLTLLLVLRGPEPVYRAFRGPAASDAVRDAGLAGTGRSAPFLPMALGSVYGVLLLRLLQG